MLSCLLREVRVGPEREGRLGVGAGGLVVGGAGVVDVLVGVVCFSRNCCPVRESRLQDFHHCCLVLALTCVCELVDVVRVGVL